MTTLISKSPEFLARFPEETHQWLISTEYFAHLREEIISAEEIVRRASDRLEREAKKQSAYNTPKGRAEATRYRSMAETVRSIA